MDLSFFTQKRETPLSLREKAESLLARCKKAPIIARGRQLAGENRLNRAGTEGDFRQFRDYRDGDRPQDIDWKRSAKSDATLMREREKKQQLVLDLHIESYAGMDFRSSPDWPTKYETAGILGTAFALWASRNQNPVYYQSERTSAANLPFEVLIQKKLFAAEYRKNAVTVLIGDYIEPIQNLGKIFSSISSRHVILFQVFDPAELDLPWHGRHFFSDNKVKTLIEDTDAVRRDYIQAMNSHNEGLQACVRKRGWHYGMIRSGEDMAGQFSAALAYLEKIL